MLNETIFLGESGWCFQMRLAFESTDWVSGLPSPARVDRCPLKRTKCGGRGNLPSACLLRAGTSVFCPQMGLTPYSVSASVSVSVSIYIYSIGNIYAHPISSREPEYSPTPSQHLFTCQVLLFLPLKAQGSSAAPSYRAHLPLAGSD